MTKTMFNALWIAGTGAVATWLAVVPQQSVQPARRSGELSRAAATAAPSEELKSQASRLRDHADVVALRRFTRNPFRFGGQRPSPHAPAPHSSVPGSAAPAAPAATLSGISYRNTPEGVKRRAVLTIDGQLYLAGEGQPVGGYYTVATVDPEAVILRDQSGSELRLQLR